MKSLEDRVKFLEGEYEKLYHINELLSAYIPKLTEANIKYLEGCTEYYFSLLRDVKKLRDILGTVLDDLQVHYKSHFDEVNKYFDKSKAKRHKYT